MFVDSTAAKPMHDVARGEQALSGGRRFGFYTTGTMQCELDTVLCHEYVMDNQSGITEVRSTKRLLADGNINTKVKFLQNGQWIPGHEIIYSKDMSAKVIFK
jgi:hypothetical protein